MELNTFVIQLALLFLPGLIWTKLDAQFGSRDKPEPAELLVRTFIFGCVTYAFVFGIYSLLDKDFSLLTLNERADAVSNACWDEILTSLLVGLFLSVAWIYIINWKLIPRFLQKIKATKRHGDEDLWDFLFNSSEAQTEYVFFRDFEQNLVYSGWVFMFSETGKLRELVLTDVEILDMNGVKLLDTPLIYISRPPDKMHIEFPYR